MGEIRLVVLERFDDPGGFSGEVDVHPLQTCGVKAEDGGLRAAVGPQERRQKAPQIRVPFPLDDEMTALAHEVDEGRERMLDHDVQVEKKHDVLKRKEMRANTPTFGQHPLRHARSGRPRSGIGRTSMPAARSRPSSVRQTKSKASSIFRSTPA
uniref:hypothetical protein n=1 Tax=Neorhizobium sp. EC2-8 TaxID=3129230 RepID=UPI0031015F20